MILYRSFNKTLKHGEYVHGDPEIEIAEKHEKLIAAIKKIQGIAKISKYKIDQRALGDGYSYAEYAIKRPEKVAGAWYNQNLHYWGIYIWSEEEKNIFLTINAFDNDKILSATKELNLKVTKNLENILSSGK